MLFQRTLKILPGAHKDKDLFPNVNTCKFAYRHMIRCKICIRATSAELSNARYNLHFYLATLPLLAHIMRVYRRSNPEYQRKYMKLLSHIFSEVNESCLSRFDGEPKKIVNMIKVVKKILNLIFLF